MADEPVSAWREPWRTLGRRWIRRHRWLVQSAGIALASALVALGYSLYEAQIRAARSAAQRLAEARGLVEALGVADIGAVPEIVRRLDPDLVLVDDRLQAMARAAPADRSRLAAEIALLRVEPARVGPLVDRLTREETPPSELVVIRGVLLNRADRITVASRVWKLLDGGPRARSEFVHFLPHLEDDPERLVNRVVRPRPENDDRTRATLALALGGYAIDRFPLSRRRIVIDSLVEVFRSSGDSGLHSALRWLLRNCWGREREVAELEEAFAIESREARTSGQATSRGWFVNGQMQTLAIIRGPVETWVGSPVGELGRRPWAEDRLHSRIPRSFAVATCEVTRAVPAVPRRESRRLPPGRTGRPRQDRQVHARARLPCHRR